jgi:hypothetical protein
LEPPGSLQADSGAAPASGGGAILARLQAQRAAAAAAAATGAAPAVTSAAAAPAPATAAAAPTPTGPPAATGGAAILARLRAQRAAKAPAAPALTKPLVVLYASQTGTAQEIAKNVQAEAEQKGIPGRVRRAFFSGENRLRCQCCTRRPLPGLPHRGIYTHTTAQP